MRTSLCGKFLTAHLDTSSGCLFLTHPPGASCHFVALIYHFPFSLYDSGYEL